MLLTPKQKLAHHMYFSRGISQINIAKALRIRPESVCRLISRAERRIDDVMKMCGAGESCAVREAIK